MTTRKFSFKDFTLLFGVAALLLILITPVIHVAPANALTQITVTVNPGKTVATNNFSLGFQLDGEDVSAWLSSSTLRGLAAGCSFKLVRIFSNLLEPCVSWSESTKTGKWDWTRIDSLVQKIFDMGAQPLIVLGFYSWASNHLDVPSGMSINPSTSLAYPEQWGAYCAEWVKHFKDKGMPVTYYEIINEPNQYFGWPATQPKLGYFMQLFNSAAKSMRAANPQVKLGNDNSIFKKVLDYFISSGERLDFISYHGYGVASLSATDSQILSAAETLYIGETTNVYGIVKAREVYKNARGVALPVFKTENNINSRYSTGTDPRTQQMMGAVYTALTVRTLVLNNASYNIYFHLGSSASDEKTDASGGFGFGMINLDDCKPWYPYYAQNFISNNLRVGNKVVDSTSSSDALRTLAWINGDKLNILLISKTTAQSAVSVSGVAGYLNYTKIDNTVSWLTPKVQTGRILAQNAITLNGYTVMLLQAPAPSAAKTTTQTTQSTTTQSTTANSIFSDSFESKNLNQWTGSTATSGETVTVVNTVAHDGTYSAGFTTNGGGSTEQAFIYKNLAPQSNLYVRAYFNIGGGLPLRDTDDRFNLLAFEGEGGIIASLGVRHSSDGADVWSVTSMWGTWYSTGGPSMNRWYCVDFYVKVASSGGNLTMWVDGVRVLSKGNLNTASMGSVVSVRTGLTYVSGVTSSIKLNGDSYTVANIYPK